MGLLATGAAGTTQETVDESANAAPHAAGELLVVYEPGFEAAAEESSEEAEGEIEGEIPEINTQVVEFPEVKNEPTEAQREQLLEQKKQELEKDPAVESVSYNYIYKAAYTPNDSRFSNQYGLRKIKAPKAWNRTRGGGASIAVVDTGISNGHPDLRRKIIAQANCINPSTSDLSCTEGPQSAEDDNGHGTRVAGVAGAVTNNGEGMAGACPNCKLLIAKSLNANNVGTASDVAGGIIWSTDQGADVINLSLGAEEADATPVRKAVRRAQNRGATVVAAAGNYGRNSGTVYPAAYRNVIAVAATDRKNRRVSSSSTGDWVDIAAPGDRVLSTSSSGRYGRYSGTSFSSPFVAGVAGLLSAQGRSEKQIRRRINSTTTDLGPRGRDALYGRGIVDAAAAVGVRNTKPKINRPRPAPGSTVKARTPRITAIVRDRETNLKKSNLTFVLDGNRKTSFSYFRNRDRLVYVPRQKLSPGRHSVRIVARDGQGQRTVSKWSFRVREQRQNQREPRQDRNEAISWINEPGFPLNVLPDKPIFDRIR